MLQILYVYLQFVLNCLKYCLLSQIKQTVKHSLLKDSAAESAYAVQWH